LVILIVTLPDLADSDDLSNFSWPLGSAESASVPPPDPEPPFDAGAVDAGAVLAGAAGAAAVLVLLFFELPQPATTNAAAATPTASTLWIRNTDTSVVVDAFD
jgi:hypothetical protein